MASGSASDGFPPALNTDHVNVERLDSIVIQPGGGNMGLKGLWALVGNSTAMVALAVVMFVMIFQVRSMHHEGIETLKQIVAEQREHERHVLDTNTAAVKENTSELRKLRDDLLRSQKQ